MKGKELESKSMAALTSESCSKHKPLSAVVSINILLECSFGHETRDGESPVLLPLLEWDCVIRVVLFGNTI